MTTVLRKILPVKSSPRDMDDHDADDVYKPDYSFAQVYRGPPISNIPRANPLDIDQIPTAVRVSSSSFLNGVSVPVIQPIHRSNPVNKEPVAESVSVAELDTFPGSVTGSRARMKGPVAVHELLSSSSSSFPSSSSVGVDLSGSSSGQEFNHHLPDESNGLGDLRPSDELDRFQSSYKNDKGDDMDYDAMDPTKPGSDSPVHSSKDLSGKEENDEDINLGHSTRAAVTFIEPPQSSEADEESVFSEYENVDEVPRAERKGKKGSCYRCLRGNRFTEKEACIVCSAKYCCNCVLRAMGSMPEGRKCVACIGQRINESRRKSLGKSSRLLRRLLTDLEVKQIMNAEISCKANRLPPQLFYVNGKPLVEDELIVLQTCLNPPKKLKPGRYWYDKVSGYWGKEGEKPCQIISPLLSIGGNIKREASNGDTNILINNREITKVELMMLQLAGVQCEGNPHFWVSADGSYQEEGQNHVKGSIWDKKRVKLACALLSLPLPPDSPGREPDDYIDYEQKKLQKFLLVGNEKSGTSTIYKQARFLYNSPFSENERENIKQMIQMNLYTYLSMLLEARERFEEESLTEMRHNQSASESSNDDTEQSGITNIYSISTRLKAFSDWFLKEKELGNLEVIFPASSREYAPFVADLWKDPAIQATYERNGHAMLPRNAAYFLERAMDISRPDYEPSDRDILYADGVSSTGLSCMDFSFPKTSHDSSLDPDYQHDPSLRYQLVRLHPKCLGDNCKWLEMFEDVDIVIFSASLSDYDEYIEDANGNLVNKMMATKQLFESIVTHPTLVEKRFLLILNNFDLLESKIEGVPLTACEWFQDFNPVISHNRSNSRHNPPLAQRAFHYVAVKYKRLFETLVDPFVDRRRTCKNKLFVVPVTGLEKGNVDDALRYAREIIKWQVEEEPLMYHEMSTTSIDASSSS